MSRVRPLVLILSVLPGCAGVDAGMGSAGWSWPFAPGVAAQGNAGARAGGMIGEYARFSFDWRLEGDPEIMPVQVFDDGAGMWLQFAPDGAWPAVFDADDAGWRPLSYRREPPYMILDGVFEQLELRGGHLRGSIRRGQHPAMVPEAVIAPAPARTAPEPGPASAGPEAARPAPGTGLNAGGGMKSPQPEPVQGTVAESDITPLRAAGDFLGAPIGHFAVSPADLTMRQALERWASQSSWTFSPEHWAVDVDIPVVGQASFHTDFKSAVRELLAATEMGDRPLQPCFYSNRVLRVVSYAQACGRRGGMGVVS